MFCPRKILLVIFLVTLVSCRGEDNREGVDPELLDFIEAPDPDRFNLFLNPDLGTANALAIDAECIGEGCAYYKSIDPDNTRDTLDKWLQANRFKADVSDPLGECSLTQGCCVVTDDTDLGPQCSVVMAHASFRDTRDLGYGRDTYLRHDRVRGDIAVFVRNFKFDQNLGLPEGVPYGPQNLEALIQNFHAAQFSISAIEYSAFPGNDQEIKFAKFYTFDGASNFPDGKGPRSLRIDIPERGTKVEMPNACSSCHGGRGRSVVGMDGKLTSALNGGIAGDMQAHLQIVDVTTLQFANTSPYTRDEQQPFIRAMNNAVLHSYLQYKDSDRPQGSDSVYWDSQHAIEYLTSRYDTTGPNCEMAVASNPFDCLRGNYKENFTEETTPVGWKDVDPVAFRNLIAPNCLSCHLLRGSHASPGVSFHNAELFGRYANRTENLVFARGLMPSGLWNYREFWDLKNPLPLAEVLGFPASAVGIVRDNNIVGVKPPGRPVAKISAPPEAQSGTTIVVSALGSEFADQFEWTVTPESAAIVAEPSSSATELILNDVLGQAFSVNLLARDSRVDCSQVEADTCGDSDTDTVSITVSEASISTASNFFEEPGGVGAILKKNCISCHSDAGADVFPGIPLLFCSDKTASDTMYRSILKRVNIKNPTDSLLVRKPTNGASSLGESRAATEIDGYHAGDGTFLVTSEIATIVNWINTGANPEPVSNLVPEDFFLCTGTSN